MERIAMYLRLSREDDLIRDESNSITNQRELILDFIRRDKDLRKMEVVEFKDDGYSGKNMERPGMQELLELVRKQQVNCIIVKDMSRFARDYLVLGKYTEQIFPFMGIRFISINDSYDSVDCVGGVGEIDVAFKALLYDFYSEDLSEKIKTALKAGKEEGHFMHPFAPYGYQKSPKDHHILEIEEEGAKVVRRIFADYLNGRATSKIAGDLNREGVLSPSAYITRRDGREYFRKETGFSPIWNPFAVSRILKNETYAGTFVYNKVKPSEVGARSGTYAPKENWKRIENHHPAIIDRETFDRVQEKISAHAPHPIRFEKHTLTGLICCGNCGYSMKHRWSPGRPGYFCQARFSFGNPVSCIKQIRDEDLEPILLDLIRKKIQDRIEMKDFLREKNERHQKKVQAGRMRLRDMQASCDRIDEDLFHAYESYREGTTDRETYLALKKTSEQMLAEMKENLEQQRKAVDLLERESPVPDGWLKDSRYLQIEKLDALIAKLLIRKVIINKDQTIEVIWNFKNEE